MKRNARIALGLFVTAALGTITWTNETVDLLAKFGLIANPIYTFFIMNALFSFFQTPMVAASVGCSLFRFSITMSFELACGLSEVNVTNSVTYAAMLSFSMLVMMFGK